MELTDILSLLDLEDILDKQGSRLIDNLGEDHHIRNFKYILDKNLSSHWALVPLVSERGALIHALKGLSTLVGVDKQAISNSSNLGLFIASLSIYQVVHKLVYLGPKLLIKSL